VDPEDMERTMIPLAQAAEAVDTVGGWGQQAPVLALGFLAFGALVWFFLHHLRAMQADARAEREARDQSFTAAIKDISERGAAQAAACHEVQQESAARSRELAETLGGVRGAMERSLTATQDLGRVLEDAKRGIEDAKREIERNRLASSSR
jgi:hypothetical protein